MAAWKNFSDSQLESLTAGLPALGESSQAQICPSCTSQTLHWYGYRNPFREGSKITYVWCSTCRRFIGSTTAISNWDVPDPFADLGATDRQRMEHNLESFFAHLDDLWRSGVLPQVRAPRDPGKQGVPG